MLATEDSLLRCYIGIGSKADTMYAVNAALRPTPNHACAEIAHVLAPNRHVMMCPARQVRCLHTAAFALWALESAAIGAALMLYFRHRHGGKLGWTVDRTLFRHFASAGTVFWLGLICMYLFLNLDRLMLERTISFADLGRYSAAQQLNENWITLALMLSQTIAPAFVYRVQQSAQLRRNLVRLFAMTAALMVAGVLVLDALAGFIIGRVFGPDYEGAIGIFRWAVWLSVPAGLEAIGNFIVLRRNSCCSSNGCSRSPWRSP